MEFKALSNWAKLIGTTLWIFLISWFISVSGEVR
jgi:hypothetical protein